MFYLFQIIIYSKYINKLNFLKFNYDETYCLPFLMNKIIGDEIDSIIVFVKLCDWRIWYGQKHHYTYRYITVNLPFYDTTHTLKIKISRRTNKAVEISYYENVVVGRFNISDIHGAGGWTYKDSLINKIDLKNFNQGIVDNFFKLFKDNICNCKKDE